MLRVARFLRSYVRSPVGNAREEVAIPPGADGAAATFIRPRTDEPLPGWIVLHGITVTGRDHPVLNRFAHALAGSGAAVIVPDVPAWRSLRLESAAADEAIAGSIAFLRSRSEVRQEGFNLVGFSFGGTHALMSAASPEIREAIRGVVAFGAFCDLARTTRYMLTGDHEWGGVVRNLEPDPYGRWIIAGNYLRRVPEYAHMTELAAAALRLAEEAGTRGVYAAEQSYDGLKAALRAGLPPEQREVWDLLAPCGGARPSPEACGRLADRLTTVASIRDPVIEPRDRLAGLDQRVVLAHGLEDRLIPYTETLRLREALPSTLEARMFITRLFSHSRRGTLNYLDYPREAVGYFALLRQALRPS
jgi:pimeloyl-ACP methyl ester carboxylesterase